MRYQGKISGWKDDQGFGFVTPNGGGTQAFVHIKAFSSRSRRPMEGDLITYEVSRDKRQRLQADKIRFVQIGATRRDSSKPSAFAPAFTLLFCGFLVLSYAMHWLPLLVPGAYLAMSLATFLAYAIDKSAAKHQRRRTSENTLHWLALAGGWPGAVLAQRTLRHKSIKTSFQNIFWLTVVLNCCALAWLFTASGSKILQSIM